MNASRLLNLAAIFSLDLESQSTWSTWCWYNNSHNSHHGSRPLCYQLMLSPFIKSLKQNKTKKSDDDGKQNVWGKNSDFMRHDLGKERPDSAILTIQTWSQKLR